MLRKTCAVIAAATVAGGLSAAASAGEIVFDRSVHRGSAPVDYSVTVNDTDAPGFFRVSVQVDNTVNPNIADITGIFLEFEPPSFDASLEYDPTPGVDFIQQSDAILRAIYFNTDDVGNGNICGNGNLFKTFDIGIAIGESNGINGGDDYQSVVFDVRIKAGLVLEDLIAVGVRGQSVGLPDGERTDSSKEFVLLPCAADFNVDGFVDSRDILAFLNVWVAKEPVADFNADGVIDTRDLIDFMNAVCKGC